MIRLLALSLLIILPALAKATSVFDLLVREDARAKVKATLILPLDSLLLRGSEDYKSSFNFLDADGNARNWSVKVSVRGKFRRARCATPPLKLDFSKKDLSAAGLAKHDKYKLVLPCFDSEIGEELIIKEYLAYRAYALVTPNSFRTQLLRLKLVDTNSGKEKIVTAFIIEDTDEMAARIGGEEVEDEIGAPASLYDDEAEATHAFFQYLVGNGDWSMLLRRNVKLIRVNERYIPVGYDFDFTGWVGAPYATPSSDTGQRSIYERVYLGYAQDDEVIDAVALRYREKRREILALIRQSHLSIDSRMMTERFAVRFFSRLNRLRSDAEFTLYDQLRGETAAVVPSGENANDFRNMGR